MLDDYYKNNIYNPEVEKLEKAILKIEKLLNIRAEQHMVGGCSFSKVKADRPAGPVIAPPAPASKTEEEQYRILLAKLDGSYKVAEAMIANEQNRYSGLRPRSHRAHRQTAGTLRKVITYVSIRLINQPIE